MSFKNPKLPPGTPTQVVRHGHVNVTEVDYAALDRYARALALRKAGASYDQIAQQLGYADRSGAWQAVQSALKATLQEPAEDLRKLELERLDEALLAMRKRIMAGEPRAIEVMLKLQERRAKLLGLDLEHIEDRNAVTSLLDLVRSVNLKDEEA